METNRRSKGFIFSTPPTIDITPADDENDDISDTPLPGHSYSGTLPSHHTVGATDVPELVDDDSDDDDDDIHDNTPLYPGPGGRQKAALRETIHLNEILPPPIPKLLYDPIDKN